MTHFGSQLRCGITAIIAESVITITEADVSNPNATRTMEMNIPEFSVPEV
jgi:hypothetical protein